MLAGSIHRESLEQEPTRAVLLILKPIPAVDGLFSSKLGLDFHGMREPSSLSSTLRNSSATAPLTGGSSEKISGPFSERRGYSADAVASF
jgi:hypothetical protein